MAEGGYGNNVNENGKRAIFAAVLGLGLVFIPYVAPIGFLLSLGAIFFGIRGLRQQPRALAIVGLLLGLAPLVIVIVGAYTIVARIQAASG